jgi:hypothetical protein
MSMQRIAEALWRVCASIDLHKMAKDIMAEFFSDMLVDGKPIYIPQLTQRIL